MVNDDFALCMCVCFNSFSANETFFFKPNVAVISLIYCGQLCWVTVLGNYLCFRYLITALGQCFSLIFFFWEQYLG